MSSTWATEGPAVISSTTHLALNPVLLLFARTAVRDRPASKRVLSALRTGAILSAAYGIVSPSSESAPSGLPAAAGELDRLSG